ncbi:MAG: ImmA/IrrE family metallo-endopeptidase, partial [Nitrososphaera sp.]
ATLTFELLKKASSLLRSCGVKTPPVDIYKLAVHQGIREVRFEDMSLDGELRKLKQGGYMVTLNRKLPEVRKRFTLAHEIAHTLLLEEHAFASCGKQSTSNAPLGGPEEICDFIAAELLMPDYLIRKILPHSSDINIEGLVGIAEVFKCSLEAAAFKVLNSSRTRGVLLIWGVGKALGRTYLHLVARPKTRDLDIPFPRGFKVFPGTPNWDQLVNDGAHMVTLEISEMGLSYLAERARPTANRILTLIKIPQMRKGGEVPSKRLAPRSLFT